MQAPAAGVAWLSDREGHGKEEKVRKTNFAHGSKGIY